MAIHPLVRELNPKLDEISRQTFLKDLQPVNFRYSKTFVFIRQLKLLFQYMDRLPKHRFELEGMPFDRLLLTCSPTYLRTRALLLKCGVRFMPAIISRANNFRSFEPAKDTLVYTPLESELRWISQQKLDCSWIPELVPKYYFFSTTLCHESAHALIYRLLRFKGMRSLSLRENKNYIFLTETLVVVQEALVAMELQQVAPPLESFGILYRSVQDRDVVAGDLLKRDTFLSFVVDLFSMQVDRHYKRSDLSKAFAKAGKRFVHHPLMGLNSDFTDKTSPEWVTDYFKKTENRILLPKTPRSLKSAQLTISPVSPKQLLSDGGTQDRLRSWFKKLYC